MSAFLEQELLPLQTERIDKVTWQYQSIDTKWKEKPKFYTEKVTWQYQGNDTKWKEMSKYYSDLYEQRRMTGVNYFTYDVPYGKNKKNNYHYSIDFIEGVQKNCDTGKERRIRRAVERSVRVWSL